MRYAIEEHLNAPSCSIRGDIIKLSRKEVETALLTLDPNASIEEVNHQGTPLVVYSGTIPEYGDYTIAVEIEPMIQAELHYRFKDQQTIMNN